MTSEEARIVLLEDALNQAAHTISFLHGCLTDDLYQYAYPDQTLRGLSDIRELVPEHSMCVHSNTSPGCSSCKDRVDRFRLLDQARRVLNERENNA